MKKISIFTILFTTIFFFQPVSANDAKIAKEKTINKSCCSVKSSSTEKKENCDNKTAHSKGKDSCCQTKKKS